MTVQKQKNLNYKSRNVLYLWQCQLCIEDDSYIGRTIQKSHERTNTHRSCFTDESKWESSALSMHAKSVHPNYFDLSYFEITLLKKIWPQRIRREEFKLIDKFKTRTLGINRQKNQFSEVTPFYFTRVFVMQCHFPKTDFLLQICYSRCENEGLLANKSVVLSPSTHSEYLPKNLRVI